ncbi:MAG: aminodeoxychorismate synthase component I [Bacteroidales bacterium]|nr:aminodeoxychorismate synthase component I [Bacteroidales bacterium]
MIRQINMLAEDNIPFLLIVDFEMRKPLLFPLKELPEDILFSTPGYASPVKSTQHPEKMEFQSEPIPYSKYRSAFNLVRENAMMGNTYLTNLTFPTSIRTNLSLADIYSLSQAKYKLLYKDEFVVFSPEIFVQISGGQIRSYPMKGTIDANIPGAKEILLGDEKEMAEHVTIVDLIRNDLSINASRVRVEKFRYVDTLLTSHKKLLQVSSAIVGDLPGDYLSHLGEIIFSLLPAGSVSGAPKPETLRIIGEAEGTERGYYTGIMGYFDGKDFDSAVLIRYIENEDGQLVYRSGGGITFMSDPEKEYREMIDKVYVPLT